MLENLPQATLKIKRIQARFCQVLTDSISVKILKAAKNLYKTSKFKKNRKLEQS
jgi:hypothetical protein